MLSRKIGRIKAGRFSIAYRGLKISKINRLRFLNKSDSV